MQPSDPAPDLSLAPRPSTCPLLTRAESIFHACLENLSSQRCHIQCKPRLTDVLQQATVAGFSKICQRHIDFLIYRKEDWQPMVAIEFDEGEQSPSRLSRKSRDRLLVNDILTATGVPCLNVHVKEIEDIETLLHRLTVAWQQRVEILAAASSAAQTAPEPEPVTAPLDAHPLTVRLPQTMIATAA